MTQVFRGFAELEVSVDSDFVHIRQQDENGSWVIIPRYLWSSVVESVCSQIDDDIQAESAE